MLHPGRLSTASEHFPEESANDLAKGFRFPKKDFRERNPQESKSSAWVKTHLGGGFKYILFSSLLGEMIELD